MLQMRNGMHFYMKSVIQLWIFFMAVVCIANAEALILGEIQVSSTLGQALNARIAFADLSDVDVLKLKIRLADREEYKELGMQYPDGHKFRFAVVSEPGSLLPFIRISTAYPIEDPFVNLLVEVSSSAGKLIKSYTFLLDPVIEPVTVVKSPVTLESNEAIELPAALNKGIVGLPEKTGGSSLQRKKHRTKNKVHAQLASSFRDSRSHMKLTMSLSISNYDTSVPAVVNRDMLQEDLIAKEKSLEELKLQIGEMQAVINSLQDKRVSVASSVASTTKESEPVSVKQTVLTPVPAQSVIQNSGRSMGWLNVVLVIAGVLLTVLALVWYQKYRRLHDWQHAPFNDVEELSVSGAIAVPEPLPAKKSVIPEDSEQVQSEAVVPERPPFSFLVEPQAQPLAQPRVHTAASESLPFEKVSLSASEPVLDTRLRAEHTPIVPPEYAILMEANRYLRAGNDDLAENLLIQAIEVNPKNLFGYQALLRIYDKRGDKERFQNMALQLKAIGDEAAFKQAAELGRKLDPDNSLYA
jgi:hypothetical protein